MVDGLYTLLEVELAIGRHDLPIRGEGFADRPVRGESVANRGFDIAYG